MCRRPDQRHLEQVFSLTTIAGQQKRHTQQPRRGLPNEVVELRAQVSEPAHRVGPLVITLVKTPLGDIRFRPRRRRGPHHDELAGRFADNRLLRTLKEVPM